MTHRPTPTRPTRRLSWLTLALIACAGLLLSPSASAQDDGPQLLQGDGSTPIKIPRPAPQGDGTEPGAEPGAAPTDTLMGSDGALDIDSNFSPAELDLLTPPTNIKYTIDFRNAPLEDVVKFISALTRRNFIIAATLNAKKPITIISPTPVTAPEAYRAFLTSLSINGLALVRSGSFYKVIEVANLNDHQPDLIGPNGRGDGSDQYVTQIVELQNIDVSQVQPIIEQFKTAAGRVVIYAPTNTAIITDTSGSINRIIDIIRRLDQPSADDERIWVYQVRYAAAAELSGLLTQVFQQEPAAGQGAANNQRRQQQAAKGQQQQVVNAGADAPNVTISQIVPDDRTNKLIIVANERSYERIKRLILKLDIELPDSGRINVVHLENSAATDMAQVLSELTQELQPTDPRQPKAAGGAGAVAAAGAAGDQSPLLQGEVSITANEPTNDLIIVGSPRDFLAVRDVIKVLDRPRKQVFIEAVIMEVSLDRTRNVGMALHGGNVFETSAGDSYLLGRTDLGGLQSLSAAPLFLGAGSTPGLLAAFIGPSIDLGPLEIPATSVILKALQTNTDVNVLSTPTIMTLDNEEAEISVGERIPFIASSGGGGLGGLGALAGQLGNSSQATQAAGALGALGGLGGLGGLGTQIQRVDVALTLTIKPQINEAGYVRLDIKEEIEEVKPGGVELGGPTTRRRNLNTVVMVRDQETVVLGGLIRDAENQSISKVPILGDIPVIGYLFRSTETQIQKQNLLLLLTPYIIESDADKQKILERKMKEREAFLEYFGARDLNYIKHVNYSKKHGLLEQMRQTVSGAEQDQRRRRQTQGLLQLPEREEGIELPEGMIDGYDTGVTEPGAPAGGVIPPPPAPTPAPPPPK
jgi:general secretion pathway protein D